MYPTHTELIEFLHLLGYPNYKDGICFGISAMTLSPILISSTEIANERFKKIKSTLEGYKQIVLDYISEDRTPCSLSHYLDITLEIDEKIDILAYCAGVAIYFFPNDYKDCFPKDISLSQDVLLVNVLMQSIEMEKKGGLAYAGSAIGYYSIKLKESNTRDHFLTWKYTLHKMELDVSIACILLSKKHAIPISYCAAKKQWCYCIINNGNLQYIYTNDAEEIIHFIETEFFKEIETGLVIATQIYCFNKDKEKVITFKESYQSELCINGLANMSRKDDNG